MAVDGTYKIEIDSPIGKQEATLTFKTAGNVLSGKAASGLGETDFTGTVNDDTVAFSLDIKSQMGRAKLDFTGKVAGDDISGEVKIGIFGTSPFKGRRV